MRRVLDSSGLSLDRKTYYNLLRHQPFTNTDDSFQGLVFALEEAGLKFACDFDQNSEPRELIQVVFATTSQIDWAKRFISGHVLLVDGTFETNRLGLTLLAVVGITNIGRTFPAAFTFCKGETAISFCFLFETLRTWLWLDCLESRVVLADQATGLISAFPTAMPSCKLQHCTWHVAGNIKKRLAEKRYLKDERKKIMGLVWQYIQTENEADLPGNRAALLAAVKKDEQTYIRKNWQPRERSFILAYTRQDLNLGT